MYKNPPIFLKNLSLLMLSSLLCLIMGEVALRYLFPQRLVSHYDGLYIEDNDFGHKLKPGWSGISSSPEYRHMIKVNSSGFYDNEFPALDNNDIRILLLGDSFIFDVANPYGFRLSEILEKRLNSTNFIMKTNKKVDVLNMGVSAYDPYRYLLVWRHIGQKYKPSLVLLGFFSGNDYVGKPEKIVPEIPKSHYYGIKRILYPINEYLESHSHLYVLIRTFFEKVRVRYGLSDGYLPRILVQPEKAIKDVLPVMEEFSEEFKNGPPLLIFQIPHRACVDKEFAKVLTKVDGIPFEKLNYRLVPEAFIRIAKAANAVVFVDLAPPFKRSGGGKLYFPVDGHWNSKGIEVAVEKLLPEIEKILISQLENQDKT